MSKIGILGGSFNPIHNGHIYSAKEVKKQLSLDKVIFVPTGIAPHKDNSNFVKTEKWEKFPVAPTSPSPGPMLFRHDTTAVNDVVKSRPSTDTNKVDPSRTSI